MRLSSGVGLSIQSLESGGRAQQDGRLRIGDCIKQVNGMNVVGVDFPRYASTHS